VAKSDRNRQQQLRDFLDLCERVGFSPEAFQIKIATFAAWHLAHDAEGAGVHRRQQ
jgi:hypothetical protein